MSQGNIVVSSKKSMKKEPEVSPLAFLNMARQYYEAAELLFAERERRINTGDPQTRNDSPIYFLYYHTMELVLKAYRRAHNLPNTQHHKLTKLYADCEKLGLVIKPRLHIQNLVNLLQSGEEYTRFRYFSLKSDSQPSLDWVREVIGSLIQTLSDKLTALFPPDSQPEKAVKVTATFSKPRPTRESKS